MKGSLMSEIKLGLIGCGAAAKRYYLPILKSKPEIVKNLVLVDKNIALAQEMVKEIGGGTAKDDYSKIYNDVNAVIITLPHFLHYSVSMDFLCKGIHVLCEKPVAESAEELKEMNETASKNNVNLCVNNTRRMFPSFKKIKEIISNGKLGKIKRIVYVEGGKFEWESNTNFYVNPKTSSKGILFDLGSHVLDTICWWIDQEPEIITYIDDSFGGPESNSHLIAKSGDTKIEIILNRMVELDNKFIVEGDNGFIEGVMYDWSEVNIKLRSGKPENIKLKPRVKTYPDFVYPIVDNFLEGVNNDSKPLVSGEDVYNSIKLIEECYLNRKKVSTPFYTNLKNDKNKIEGKTLVTGATGFIGGRIVEYLHLKNNTDIRAGIRSWSTAARLGRFPVDIVKMDLLNKGEIEKALDNVSNIVHCAKGGGGVTDLGTTNLLQVALDKRIKRFVHLSTAEVYGNAEGVVTEENPLTYTGNEYNETKINAENSCWEFVKKGLPVTILRPSIVYGPFSTNWSVRFAGMLLAGKMGIMEKFGEGKCNLIYVDDLVSAVNLALQHENAVGNAFNICNSEIPTWNEYFIKFNDKMELTQLKEIKSSNISIHTKLLQPVRFVGNIARDHFMPQLKKIAENIELADKLMRITEKKLKSSPASDELELYSRKASYSTEKINKMLGFKSAFSLDQGLDQTVNWLRDSGFFTAI
jgi:predicted dehydrogenase/nucleoside-diphosphate-sugar epimerase